MAALALVLTPLLKNNIKRTSYPTQYTQQVLQWAGEYDVDPYLVYAFIRTESGFDEKAESSMGARGLMQMTNDTFDWVKSKIAPDEALVFDDLYDPDVAVRFGTYYLHRCLERYEGDILTAAAAYHSGWGTVDGLLEEAEYSKDGVKLDSFPYPQMRHYVNKIDGSYEEYQALYDGGN